MLEKNVLTFSQHLEELNLKNTAESFKREFISKPNDAYELGKYNILKHLQKELNKCTGTNSSTDYSPTSARKKMKQENPIFTNLISKISKREKEKKEKEEKEKNENDKKMKNDEQKNKEKSINKNSKLFLYLSSQIKKQYETLVKEKNKKNKNFLNGDLRVGNFQDLVDKYDDGYGSNEELPMFGSAINKKKKEEEININLNSNEFNTDEEINNNNKNNMILDNSFGEINNNMNIDVCEDSTVNENNNTSKNKTKEENNYNILKEEEIKNNYNNEKNTIEEYQDDEDPGYDLYECDIEYFADTCQKLSEDNDFPHRGVYKSKYRNYKPVKIPFIKPKQKIENAKIKLVTFNPGEGYKLNMNPNQDEIWKHSKLSRELNFPKAKSDDDYYPIYYNGQFIDSYSLKVVVDRERTGFEESKDFKIVINNLIAGRYQILGYLGNAAFSKAVKCLDTKTNTLVCLKIIENNKNYFDQSLDEIKVLNFVNANGEPDELNFLKSIDFFYYKEHLIIVTELLNDNLYDFYDYLLKNKIEEYFSMPRIQAIAKQVLTSLKYIHSLHLIHCDLKPENILLKCISKAEVKIIDFGSSNFIYDATSSYIQSRSYRAPEVIMGCNYDYKIDIWSLGCILAELYSKTVLFMSDSVHSLLARVIGIIGPIPEWMFEKGTTVNGMFCKEKLLFMEADAVNDTNANISTTSVGKKKMHVIVPKRTLLKNRLHCEDQNFIDFLRYLLKIDPNERPTAEEALNHPWFKVQY
jgi:serine/threonine protein kinase